MGEKIVSLLKAGKTYTEIRAVTGCSKSTINYYAKKLGTAKSGRTYDWAGIQAHHDAGNSRLACQRAFGFCAASWTSAIKRGELVARDRRIPMDELLVENRSTRRAHLKIRLVTAGLLTSACHECGLTAWRGKPISLALHHVNGVGTDNRIENLQLLCPNCHSQTPNFAGRNKRAAANTE